MFGVSPAVASKPLPGSVSVSVPAQPDVEEVDAMDSRGVWYQAFIVKRDEKEALVHFSGWGKDTAEQIRLSDFSKRIRARSASTATGQLPIPSIAEVRKMFGVSLVGTPGSMPPGWEILQDSSGKTYYGNREMKKVQWEHPSMGVSTGKHSMAAQHSWMGAVNQIMSLRLRGKKIAPETNAQLSGGNNNNFIQRFKMWGTLLSELFKVAMACLLSVFVPQNCPPSITFDKEYWHPCEIKENLVELNGYNWFVLVVNFITCCTCAFMYLVEARRESWLIEYLDANPAESRDALDKVLKSNKYNSIRYGLESQNRYLRNAALFNLIVFLFNALISGLLLFLPQADTDYHIGFYLDGRTATVYITNVLLLVIKLYDTVNLTKISSLENKGISTALKEPVYFNVIDPKHLRS